MRSSASPRLPSPALLVLLAAVSLLSHLRAAVPGLTYYFRDMTTAFIPLRLFSAAELRAGRWPLWNPFVQEGTFALPSLYPVDLLHVLRCDPATISWLLTLHFPIAALGCYALARELGAGRPGAFAAGSIYALGGFAASCLNLYVYLQALALAPFVVVALRRAAVRRGRSVAVAGLAVGMLLTTLAIEFVAQAVLLGCCLGLVAAPRLRPAARLGAALLLGLGLGALPVAIVVGVLRESVRGAGFDPGVALGNELHPATLLQVLVPGLFGSLSSPVEQWWGGRFFTKGFPYFLSLYLGPLALGLAAAGPPAIERRLRFVLLLLAAGALWYCLGARGGLAWLASQLPPLRLVRFPSKAFLTPHLVVALLAGFGLERLRAGAGWLGYAAAAGGLGAGVLALLASVVFGSGGGLVPWEFAGVQAGVVRECSLAAAVALAGAGLALAVARGLLSLRAGLLATVALLVADLARAGSGINPQVDPAFFRPLPEMAALGLGSLGGGRVFTYGLDYSPAFNGFLKQPVPGRGLWSFFLSRQLLAPYANLLDGVEVAEAKDLTSFVVRPSGLGPEDYDPAAVGGILDRLRDAAVSRVLSLDPLHHPDLRLQASVRGGPPGLSVHVYELLRPWPRAYLVCRDDAHALSGASGEVEVDDLDARGCAAGSVRGLAASPQEARYDVEAPGPGFLVTRDTWARGWRATVDGRSAPVLRVNGKHRAVPIQTGRHEVEFRYDAPGRRAGLLLTVIAGVVTLAGLVWKRDRSDALP